ncbi:MAG: alpha/beta hydrolase [Gammaproteobacteria bacterium]|nr:MAG: alpha/beta hydrolase [Gammaproteobacteria bacterium]
MPVYSTFDQSALDREYSPSSCIDGLDVYLDEYTRASKVAKSDALKNQSCETDLRYGAGTEETLDLFLPAESGPAPLHVFIHGGYWQLLSKDESCFAAPIFQQRGSFFAAVNYTLAPRQTLTGIVEENRRAITWLYQNAGIWGFDRDRIYLSGHSAGAHLAMMMLLTDWPQFGLPRDVIKGVCAVSGLYDLEPVRLCYVNDVVGMDISEAGRNSPLRHSLVNPCPVILAYGDNETGEFKRQTDDYRRVLQDADIPVTLSEIADRNHFDVILDLAQPDTWLSQQVFSQMGIARAS